VRRSDQGAGGRLLGHTLLDLAPLVEEEAEVADKEAGLLPLASGADDDAHALGEGELGENLAETGALLGILDLTGDAALVIEGHEDHVAAGHRDIRGDAGTLGADGALGNLYHDLAADGIDGGDVLGGELLLGRGLTAGALDGLNAAVERGGNGIPEVEEGVLLEADIDEHRLQPMLDVADLALENAADDVALAVALDGVLFQLAILQDGDAFFEFLAADDQLDAGACFFHAEEAFDGVDNAHGNRVLGVRNRCLVV